MDAETENWQQTGSNMEDIISSKESVVSDCCESQSYKDVNEDINNSDIVSSIINLKNNKKATRSEGLFEYISDIHLVNSFMTEAVII